MRECMWCIQYGMKNNINNIPMTRCSRIYESMTFEYSVNADVNSIELIETKLSFCVSEKKSLMWKWPSTIIWTTIIKCMWRCPMEMLNLIQLISKFVSNSIGICMVNMSFSFVCFSNTELRKVFKTIRSAGRSNISRLMVVINSKPLVDLGEKIVEWRTNGSKPLKRFTKFHWPKNGLIILNIEAIYNIVKHYQKQGVIIKFQYEDDYSVKMARLSAQSAKKSKQLKD